MLKKGYFILVFTVLLVHQLRANDDYLFFTNGIRLCAKSGNLLLLSNRSGQMIGRHVLDGQIRHTLLIGKQRLSVQTSKFSYIYQISGAGIELESRSVNPFDSEQLDNYFFLNWEGKKVIFTEKGGSIEITFHKTDMDKPKHIVSYIPVTRKRALKGEKQILFDYKAGYLYFNLSNSEHFFAVNTHDSVVGSHPFKAVSGLDRIRFGNWYFDVISERCYLLVSSRRSLKLFKYDNGGPEKTGGKRTGKIIIYKNDKNLMELGMMVQKLDYIPLIIHGGNIWENLSTKQALNH